MCFLIGSGEDLISETMDTCCVLVKSLMKHDHMEFQAQEYPARFTENSVHSEEAAAFGGSYC